MMYTWSVVLAWFISLLAESLLLHNVRWSSLSFFLQNHRSAFIIIVKFYTEDVKKGYHVVGFHDIFPAAFAFLLTSSYCIHRVELSLRYRINSAMNFDQLFQSAQRFQKVKKKSRKCHYESSVNSLPYLWSLNLLALVLAPCIQRMFSSAW